MDEEFDVIDETASRGHTPEPDDDEEGPRLDRRAVLEPAIQSVVTALGGYENGVYVLGDEAYGCLKDLKKYWRKDDTDDDRTVARIFWDARLLFNDLIPIILETAGKGQGDNRCALACLDLIAAMTWPIDLSSELQEVDEEDGKLDYATLLQAHLHYKAAILGAGVMEAIVFMLIPPMQKDKRERTPRDHQIIHVAMYLFRNLAYIKDAPYRANASAEADELASLQSRLVVMFKEQDVFDLLIVFAGNAEDDQFSNSVNTLVLEVFYLLFRGVKPDSIVADQRTQASQTLAALLASEDVVKVAAKRTAPTRHSRFGTSITIQKGNQRWNLHKQEAIHGEAGALLDQSKKKLNKKVKVQDELGTFESLSYEARVALQGLAEQFVQDCFNPFLASLLKDIRAERAKVTEKDNLRLLFVAKWFMEYFVALQAKEAAAKNTEEPRWTFGLVATIVERSWIAWMLKRMRGALDEKPKLWVELQAGLECVTQLLLLVEAMSKSANEEYADAADALQHQLWYNGEILDLCYDALKTYKDQSIAYLHATVHTGFVLLRMLEAWGKTKGEMYVQRKRGKKKKKRKAQGNDNEELGILEDVNDDDEPTGGGTINESILTFEKYEAKFADEDICHTLLVYLAQFRQFDSPKCMKRVVTLLHRQAVKVKAEGLFFKVTTLNLFRSILDENKKKLLPQDAPYQDLLKLINFILRKFFKAAQDDPFLLVEAFFPKNRGGWKQYSSWEPPPKEEKKGKAKKDGEGLEDVSISKRFTWSQQVGIAVGCLVDAERNDLVEWTKEILVMVIGMRQAAIEDAADENETQEQTAVESGASDNEGAPAKKADNQPPPPPQAAIDKFKDYVIPYPTEEKARAATHNSFLKLLWGLLRFEPREQVGDELEWYVPRSEYPHALETCLKTVTNYLLDPIDVDGKRPRQLLSKKRKRRSPSPSSGGSGNDSDSSKAAERKKRKERKKKEAEVYKSAAIINDSDEEVGDEVAFLAKERAQRERYALKAAAAGTEAPRGGNKKKTQRKRRKTSPTSAVDVDGGEESDSNDVATQGPKLAFAKLQAAAPTSARATASPRSSSGWAGEDSPAAGVSAPKKQPLFLGSDSEGEAPPAQSQPRRPGRIVISDSE